MENLHQEANNNVVSLRERKYTKMYKDFYSKGRLDLALDSKSLANNNERRFVGEDGYYHVIRVVNQ
jgi:hypothetical protein